MDAPLLHQYIKKVRPLADASAGALMCPQRDEDQTHSKYHAPKRVGNFLGLQIVSCGKYN
ncbi:hypothetical protein KDAU_42650 [Dictyobacter aurantiacus]|uniref:Uncharacterized protein n=1 Tax=Dictyobacter aurantiacus TaxID=1936993 RepID=A0A401ZJA5_9CHLR|nr:hypothetical protein KDAU_42650 [Dictyobacter aurantiacus]